MWRFALLQAVKFIAWLAGALVAAAAVSALAVRTAPSFLTAFLGRGDAYSRLDFGASSVNGFPAWQVVMHGLPATLELVLVGAAIAFAAGIPLGITLAHGSTRRILAPAAQFVSSMPVFCAGLALAWFAINLFHFSPDAQDNVGAALGLGSAVLAHNTAAAGAGFRLLLVPALMVGAAGAASVHLALRRASNEAGSETYRHGLKLMGLGSAEIERVYVVPQVVAGVFANLGDILLALVSATAVAEWVFDWPGDAVLFIKSVALHDWNVAAVVLFVFAAMKFTADFAGALAARALANAGDEA